MKRTNGRGQAFRWWYDKIVAMMPLPWPQHCYGRVAVRNKIADQYGAERLDKASNNTAQCCLGSAAAPSAASSASNMTKSRRWPLRARAGTISWEAPSKMVTLRRGNEHMALL